VLAATAEIPKSLPFTAPTYFTDTAPPFPVATLLLNVVDDEKDIADDVTVAKYTMEMAPPSVEVLKQSVKPHPMNATAPLVTAPRNSKSIAPPRGALQPAAVTPVAVKYAPEGALTTVPETTSDRAPPNKKAELDWNDTRFIDTEDSDAACNASPTDKYTPPPLPVVDTHFLNVVVPDTPTNENDVAAPGTTTDTQPPLLPAFPLLNTLLVIANVDRSLVTTLLKMLTAPPTPLALTSVNIDPLTIVVIPVYTSLINDIAPPF